MISRSISTSEKVTQKLPCALKQCGFSNPLAGVLLYTWLHPHADDFGRMDGSAFWIKFNIVPTLDIQLDDVNIILNILNDVDLIKRYKIKDKEYIQIIDFEIHQSGLHKRTESIFPEFPGISKEFTVEEKGREGEVEEKGREKKRKKNPGTGKTVPVSPFEFALAMKWVQRAKQNFKTVKANHLIFAKSIHDLIEIDKLSKELIEKITEYLEVDRGGFWFKQIGTPEKLRQRTKDKQFKIWEKVIDEMRNTPRTSGDRAKEITRRAVEKYGAPNGTN